MKSWNNSVLCPLIITATTFICYWNSLKCGLVYDDLAAIRDNRDVRPYTPLSNVFYNDFWGTPIKKEESHKSYRPLTILTFRFNYFVHGLSSFGYHLPNVILHVVVCLLFHRVCLLLLPRTTTAFVSAIGFTVHPIHTEAVTGVVGRAELLSAFFYLCAFLSYASSGRYLKLSDFQRILLTAGLAGTGMFCKEQSVTVLLLCLIYEVITSKIALKDARVSVKRKEKSLLCPWIRRCRRRCSILMLCTVILLCLRTQVVGCGTPAFSRLENPASMSNSPSRQLTYNYLMALNSWLLLFPLNLCCDWTMGSIPVISGLWDIRNLQTVAFYVVVFLLFKTAFQPHRTRLDMSMGLFMIAVPFLPASNLLFPVGFVVAERILYLPSMGFCMIVAIGWTSLWEKSAFRNMATFGLIMFFFLHSWRTNLRNNDWKDEISLYSSALKVNRNNAKLLNNMGKALEAISNDKYDALQYYEEATRVQPDDVRGHLNVGRVLTSLGRYGEAESAYRRAKSLLPQPGTLDEDSKGVTATHLQVFLHLASLVAKNHSRLEEADDLYRQALNFKSDFTNAYLNRGDILRRLNRTKEAEAMYQKALLSDNSNPDLYFNLAIIVMDQGRTDDALKLFNKVLEIDPEHEKALINSAALIQEVRLSSYRTTAIDRLKRAVARGQINESIFMNLGMLTLENQDISGAEYWFRKALEIKPNSSSALFNLALLLSDVNPAESLLSLERLLQNYPHHVKGLLLLGDISVTYLRNLDAAEQCYRRVMSLESNNMQGFHNLCVVHLERGDIYAAEKCFAEAASLYPGVRFIRDHLETTRALLKESVTAYGMQEMGGSTTTAIR